MEKSTGKNKIEYSIEDSINTEKIKNEVDKHKKKIKEVKALMKEWGNYRQLIAMEKREFEAVGKIHKEINNIKNVCNDISKNNVFEIVPPDIDYNVSLCKGRLESLHHQIKEIMSIKVKIDNIVDKLDFMEKYILKERYINKQLWDNLPIHMPFIISKRHCQRIHEGAIEKIYLELKKMGELD